MFLSLWVFTSCTKPPVSTVDAPRISVSLPDIDRDSDTIPIVLPEPTLSKINTDWSNHPEWHWTEYDIHQPEYSHQSEWNKDTVKVWTQTPCEDDIIQWHNPTTGETGSTQHKSGDFWLTQPYAKHHRGIRITLSCGDWSSTIQWHKRESSAFPNVEMTRIKDALELHIHHGQSHHLDLEFRTDQQWIPLESLIITAPLKQILLSQPTASTEIRWTLTPLNNSKRPTLSNILATNIESIQFKNSTLRWRPNQIHQGDIIATTHVVRNNTDLTERQSWMVGNALNSVPLPSDQIAGLWTQEAFVHSKRTFKLPTTLTSSMLSTDVRMDTQASDARLTQFIPLLYSPDNVDIFATTLYFTSLYWDALSDRDLPWTNSLLAQSHQAIQYFDSITIETWHQWSYNTQMKVLLAILASEQNGQAISSRSMHALLKSLCDLPGVDIPKDAALMGHIQWLVKKHSQWRHLACPISNPIPIWSHPQFKNDALIIQQSIDDGVTDWILPILPPLNDVHNWWQWKYETEVHKRYTNLTLTVKYNDETQRGLFHEWQFKPTPTSVQPSEFLDLTVSGVGRLYLSEWQFAPGTLPSKEEETLTIRRTIHTPNRDTLDLNHLNLGQELEIEYQIQSKPHSRVCMTEWNSSGLSTITNHMQHCITTDSSGTQTVRRKAWVMFNGRFKLPAVFISNGQTLVHTEDLWLQTTDFTRRSGISENVIQ